MRLKLNEDSEDAYFVTFNYDHPKIEAVFTDLSGTEYKGAAVCSKSDRFNRKVGRKIALGRALQTAFPSEPTLQFKDNRRTIWELLVGRGFKLH